MNYRFIIGLLPFAFCIIASAHTEAPIPAFHAEYQVSRNGKDLAHASLDLHRAGDHWEFITQTRGTEGLAHALGLDVRETSEFQWQAGLPQGLQYRYAQKAAFTSRQRSIQFDWTKNQAQSHDDKHDWELALKPGAMDRNLIVLALSADLNRKATQFNYPVVERGKLDDKRYVQTSRETVRVPAGEFSTVRMERQRTDTDKRTTSWYAPERDYLPVQLEQQETNGDTVTMRLVSLQIESVRPEPAPGAVEMHPPQQ